MRRAQQQSGSSFDFTSALYAASLAKINSITLQIVRRREGGPSVDSEQSPQPPALEFLSAGRTKLRAKTLVWVLIWKMQMQQAPSTCAAARAAAASAVMRRRSGIVARL